jgi:hypothetical protein
MSRIDNNHLVKGARGNFNKEFVYRKRGEDTHISRMPRRKKGRTPSVKESNIRDLFLAAVNYAKGAMSSPELKKEYGKRASGKNSAYNIAFRDYTKPPVVKVIETERYTGNPGSAIVVSAMDDFRVAGVSVRITNAAGVLIEEGNAIQEAVDRNKWTYTVTTANATLAGTVIRAVAKDLPGNKAELEISV